MSAVRVGVSDWFGARRFPASPPVRLRFEPDNDVPLRNADAARYAFAAHAPAPPSPAAARGGGPLTAFGPTTLLGSCVVGAGAISALVGVGGVALLVLMPASVYLPQLGLLSALALDIGAAALTALGLYVASVGVAMLLGTPAERAQVAAAPSEQPVPVSVLPRPSTPPPSLPPLPPRDPRPPLQNDEVVSVLAHFGQNNRVALQPYLAALPVQTQRFALNYAWANHTAWNERYAEDTAFKHWACVFTLELPAAPVTIFHDVSGQVFSLEFLLEYLSRKGSDMHALQPHPTDPSVHFGLAHIVPGLSFQQNVEAYLTPPPPPPPPQRSLLRRLFLDRWVTRNAKRS